LPYKPLDSLHLPIPNLEKETLPLALNRVQNLHVEYELTNSCPETSAAFSGASLAPPTVIPVPKVLPVPEMMPLPDVVPVPKNTMMVPKVLPTVLLPALQLFQVLPASSAGSSVGSGAKCKRLRERRFRRERGQTVWLHTFPFTVGKTCSWPWKGSRSG